MVLVTGTSAAQAARSRHPTNRPRRSQTIDATEITPATDLNALLNVRVVIGGVKGGTFHALNHARPDGLLAGKGVVGTLHEDPHPGCRGGMTATFLEYGTTVLANY